MTEMQEAIAQLDSRKRGWFKDPVPTAFDATVARVVDGYVGAEGAARAEILDAIDIDRARTLSAYAERMASLAVHEKSPDPLIRGLVAIGLAAKEMYHKELIILLPLFWHSAARIGVDGTLLFTSAADLIGDGAPSWIKSFPDRDERDRSLEAMHYEEHEEPNGLLYRRAF